MKPRLKTGLWVKAALRFIAEFGGFGVILHRGDEDAGAVLIKQNFQNGRFRLLGRVTTEDDRALWRPLGGEEPVEERLVDAAIEKRRKMDRDLWVLEIEDREGRLPLGEALFSP